MRAALIQVKEDLGADAVILSNKKIPDGIEIVAAMDYDASAFHKKVKTQKSPVNNQPVFPSKMIDDSITKISKSNNDEIKDDTAEEIDSLSALLERQQSKRKQQQNKPQQKSVKLPKWAQDLAEIKTPKSAKKEATVINNNKIEFPKELRSESKVSKNDDISAIKNEIHSLKNILIFQCSNLLSQENTEEIQ